MPPRQEDSDLRRWPTAEFECHKTATRMLPLECEASPLADGKKADKEEWIRMDDPVGEQIPGMSVRHRGRAAWADLSTRLLPASTTMPMDNNPPPAVMPEIPPPTG